MDVDIFQVVADPTRRSIIECLRAGEQQVNELVSHLDVHQSGVSRHLRILLEAGFVRVRPQGQRRLYSLQPAPFRELEAWLARYRDVWAARMDRFDAAARKTTKARAKRAKETEQ